MRQEGRCGDNDNDNDNDNHSAVVNEVHRAHEFDGAGFLKHHDDHDNAGQRSSANHAARLSPDRHAVPRYANEPQLGIG